MFILPGYYTRRRFFHLPLSSRMMNTTARTIQSMVIATQTPKTPICPPCASRELIPL